MKKRNAKNYGKRNTDNGLPVEEGYLWASEVKSGFAAFKRRIDEQLQLSGFDVSVEDEDLLPFYRMGESETYVLSALGCAVGM